MKNKVLYFLLGALIFGSIGVYAGSRFNANEIGYTDRNNNEITVERALTTLYNQADGIFESLDGIAVGDRSTATVNYTSTFDGKILAVITHYTPTNSTNSSVKVNNNPVTINNNFVGAMSNGYARRVEYAVFDVVEGQSVTCTTANSTGATPSWSLSSCSLYRIG